MRRQLGLLCLRMLPVSPKRFMPPCASWTRGAWTPFGLRCRRQIRLGMPCATVCSALPTGRARRVRNAAFPRANRRSWRCQVSGRRTRSADDVVGCGATVARRCQGRQSIRLRVIRTCLRSAASDSLSVNGHLISCSELRLSCRFGVSQNLRQVKFGRHQHA